MGGDITKVWKMGMEQRDGRNPNDHPHLSQDVQVGLRSNNKRHAPTRD